MVRTAFAWSRCAWAVGKLLSPWGFVSYRILLFRQLPVAAAAAAAAAATTATQLLLLLLLGLLVFFYQ